MAAYTRTVGGHQATHVIGIMIPASITPLVDGMTHHATLSITSSARNLQVTKQENMWLTIIYSDMYDLKNSIRQPTDSH